MIDSKFDSCTPHLYLDNLELKLLDVHLRYEDALTLPGRVISAGFTVDALTITTTDADWNEKFVVRSPTKEPSSINKLGTLLNAGIYWNTDSEVLAGTEDWEARMQALVFSSERDSVPVDYVLRPPSALRVKFVHHQNFPEGVPRYDIAVESKDVCLQVDKEQCIQLLRLMHMLSKVRVQWISHCRCL